MRSVFHLRAGAVAVIFAGIFSACSSGGRSEGSPGAGGGPGAGGASGTGGSGLGGAPPAVSKLAGPSGATIALADRTRLEIPAGALAADTMITVRQVSAAPLPTDATAGSAAYAFEPHGLTFATPVTLVLPLASTANLGNLVVMKLANDQDTSWEWVDGATPDALAAEVRVPTTTFSVYQATRVPPRFDTVLPGSFPVASKYWGQGGPLVQGSYVYWSPGDGTIRSAPLGPGAQVSTIFREPSTSTNPNPDVILKALGPETAYFLTGSVLRPLRLPEKTPVSIVPNWTSDIQATRVSLNHWLVHDPIIFAGSTAGRIYTDSGVVDETAQPIPYIDGTCVQSPDHSRVMCVDVEFEFDSRAQRQLIILSKGASNLGVETANTTSWFVIDGEGTYEGTWQIHRIPFGGGSDDIVLSGPDKGTSDITAMATDTALYVLRDCHQLTTVTLAAGFVAKTKELMLDANGPCVRFLHFDASYVYLHTARGLIRMTHAELQR